MALLVRHSFSNEAASRMASTANSFDPSGLETGFQIHVQDGDDLEVVHPPAGFTSDSDAYGRGAGNNTWYAMDVEFKFDRLPVKDAKLQGMRPDSGS
jgi:hypothetical protein